MNRMKYNIEKQDIQKDENLMLALFRAHVISINEIRQAFALPKLYRSQVYKQEK